MQTRILLLFLLLSAFLPELQGQPIYRVDFTDKANSPYSVSRPGEFLSERALARRDRQGIPVDATDLPVNPGHIQAISQTGAIPLHTSRWFNALTVRLPHDSLASTIARFPFVKQITLTKPAPPGNKNAVNKFGFPGGPLPIDTSRYGASVYQTGQLNGQALHNRGFTGKGMVIAVLDAGFYRVDELPAFDSLRMQGRLLGTRDFVNPSSDLYDEHTHGMMVLSCMGGNLPGRLVGTAPHASYWLIRTEDGASEFPVEEDNWIAGAELADSVGADIINSSLGYSTYDLAEMSHIWSDMDGKTTRVARGANMAATKGMLVVSSAGNEARNPWHRILSPADGDSVIAVAAVTRDGIRATFSSVGPAADNDVKPDLAAMGQNTVVQNFNGQVAGVNGTSFSSPVLAGMAACLWQAFPAEPAWKIKQSLLRSGHHHLRPDSLLGYGIPDMGTAGALLGISANHGNPSPRKWSLFPLPFGKTFTLLSTDETSGETTAELFSLTGQKLFATRFSGAGPHLIEGLGHLPFGVWILQISGEGYRERHKIMGGSRP